MKRMAFILVLCLIATNLFACSIEQEHVTSVTSFPQANFNNDYWFCGDFWAFDDTVFYLKDGFYNMGAYWSVNGNSKKLFEESDFITESTEYALMGEIFICDSWLYFDIVTDQENFLYRYDLNDGSYAQVCEVPALYRWVVVDDYFIYMEDPSYNEEKHAPLCMYNMLDGSTTEVCPNIEEFGIVDGQLRYITNTDAYELYQYNYSENHSTILGTFYCEFDDAYDIFNFTPDGVIMLNWSREYDRNLVVYSLASNSTAVYTLPKEIHHMVACDQYAYAVVYDTQKNSSIAVPAEENGIYRINLTDGSYEIVDTNASDDTELHVISDDRICIVQRETNVLRSQRHVYIFDYATGNKEELTTL